ncbi:MAG: monovalent cation/H+ antiporter complex subunit F [Candidatus Dechloromonas phosphoritropha]|jgi:multicomponent Na+:H+ antiporter subunit F
MTEFLVAAACLVLVATALGLLRLLRGPGDAERMMAAQLLGTGGIAALLLGSTISDPAIADAALTLALLAAFASVAFVKYGSRLGLLRSSRPVEGE